MAGRVRVLRGGYLNDGRVTRHGNRVLRRQDHPWPDAVNEALEILAFRGFSHCPRLVNRIDACSVTLTYLPGRALSSPVPRWAARADTLVRATHFIREFAVAAAGMRRFIAAADWLAPPGADGDDLVHGDPHPTNLVFNPFRRPTGLIDFELATLGPPVWNLMSLIFTWAPLEPVSVTCWREAPIAAPEQRVQTILRHWHTPVSWQELITACHEFVRWRKGWITALADLGNTGARRFLADQDFNRRLNHATATMTSIGATMSAGRTAAGLQAPCALDRE